MLNKEKRSQKTRVAAVVTMALTLGAISLLPPVGGIAKACGGYGGVVAEGGKAAMLRQCRCVYTTGELLARNGPCDDSVANTLEIHRVWVYGDDGPQAWIVESSRAQICEQLKQTEYEFSHDGWIQDVGEGQLTEWLEKAGIAITPH